jgi:hypothetical protein
MKHFTLHFTLFTYIFLTTLFSQNAYEVYINEIRADDASTDDQEFIELIGPAGTDLTGFQIIHYNGTESLDGGLWTHTIGSFIIPDDGITDDTGNALGFYVLGCSNNSIDVCDEVIALALQNGPDGIILYDAASTILDAVAWQDAGDLPTDDPGTVTTTPPASANVFLHITSDDDAGDNSLQAPNDVLNDDGSGWILDTASPGMLNTSQTSGDIHLPVELISFAAQAGDMRVTLTWSTASELNNMGFILQRAHAEYGLYEEIAHYQYCDALKGLQNSSQQTDYSYTDHNVFNGIEYWYKLLDVDSYGNLTEKAIVSATPNISEQNVTVHSKINIPQTYDLHQNFPNPFNPSTVIRFEIPGSEHELVFIQLTVYNLLGQQVKLLMQDWLPSGSHVIQWDGLNEKGYRVPSGTYFYTLSCNQFFASKKMILTR